MKVLSRVALALAASSTTFLLPSPAGVSALACNMWSSAFFAGFASHNVYHPSPFSDCTGQFMHGNYGLPYAQAYFIAGPSCQSHRVGLADCVPNTQNCQQGDFGYTTPLEWHQVRGASGYNIIASAYKWDYHCVNYTAL